MTLQYGFRTGLCQPWWPMVVTGAQRSGSCIQNGKKKNLCSPSWDRDREQGWASNVLDSDNSRDRLRAHHTLTQGRTRHPSFTVPVLPGCVQRACFQGICLFLGMKNAFPPGSRHRKHRWSWPVGAILSRLSKTALGFAQTWPSPMICWSCTERRWAHFCHQSPRSLSASVSPLEPA